MTVERPADRRSGPGARRASTVTVLPRGAASIRAWRRRRAGPTPGAAGHSDERRRPLPRRPVSCTAPEDARACASSARPTRPPSRAEAAAATKHAEAPRDHRVRLEVPHVGLADDQRRERLQPDRRRRIEAVAEVVQPPLQVREDPERHRRPSRQPRAAEATGAAATSRHSTTSSAMPIGNIAVSSAGASIGGMPM